MTLLAIPLVVLVMIFGPVLLAAVLALPIKAVRWLDGPDPSAVSAEERERRFREAEAARKAALETWATLDLTPKSSAAGHEMSDTP